MATTVSRNPLEDLIPAAARKQVYAVLTLAALVFGAWQAAQGNWAEFVASVLSFLGTGLATANTSPTPGPEYASEPE